MKHDAFDHPKFDWAASDLGMPIAYFRGTMITLWHATKMHYPAGDIGRESNKRIAWRAGFQGDAELFVETLVKHGFLDPMPDEQGRLYVHNWHVHCEDYVRQTLRNRKTTFANGAPPYLSKPAAQAKAENNIAEQCLTENNREPQTPTEKNSCVVPETGNRKPETNTPPLTPPAGGNVCVEPPRQRRARGDFSDPFTDGDGFDWQPYHRGFGLWIGEANTVNGNEWLDVKAQLETAKEHDLLPSPEDWQAWCRRRREEFYREKGAWPLYAKPLLAKMREQHNEAFESRRKAAAKNGAGP